MSPIKDLSQSLTEVLTSKGTGPHFVIDDSQFFISNEDFDK